MPPDRHIRIPVVAPSNRALIVSPSPLPIESPLKVRVCAFPMNRLGLSGIGISPDCNPENRASPLQLFNWALEPAEDYVLDKLYELGYLDAVVWAEQNPVESIVEDESVATSP